MLPFLRKLGEVALTPQGYLKGVDEAGVIYQREWTGFEEYLVHAAITMVSEEDLSQGNVFNEGLLGRIRSCSPIVALTRAGNGVSIYSKDEGELHIPAFPLDREEIVDVTGAGDTFAAAFIVKFRATQNLYEAGVFACLFAAMKISNREGIGINTVPTLDQRYRFVEMNTARIEEYLDNNNYLGPIQSFL